MFTITKKKLLLLIISVFISLPAQVIGRDSDSELSGGKIGNASDGVYIDGKFLFRDFLKTTEIVLDNKKYLENIPAFKKLITDIAQVHPVFALMVWNDLMNAKIWLTDEKLLLLPENQTTLAGEGADEQIAIRDGLDIIISKPSFDNAGVKENDKNVKEYILFHEALHGIIRGTGPFHHVRVQAITKYFKDNRDNYNRKDIDILFSKIDLRADYRHSRSKLKHLRDQTLQILINEEGSFENRCSLLKLINNNARIDYKFYDESMTLKTWSNYNECSVNYDLELFKEHYPTMISTIYRRPSIFFSLTYKISPPKKIGKHRKHYKNYCQKYATEKEFNINTEKSQILEKMKEELIRFKVFVTDNTNDQALCHYFKLIKKNYYSMSEYALEESQDKLQESWENYNDNVKRCNRLGFLKK